MSQDNAPSTRSTSEIESELADTRTRIDHTLELLEDRFRPSVLMDQAWHYARSKNEEGTTTRLQETIARNPLPVVLMGVGLAWLLLSGRDGSVPQAESPLTEGATDEGATDRSHTSEQAATQDDSRPTTTKAAASEHSSKSSASANSKPAETARTSQHDHRRQETKPTHDSSPSTGSTVTGSHATSHDDSPETASKNTRPSNS